MIKKVLLIVILVVTLVQADQIRNGVKVGQFVYSIFAKGMKTLPKDEILKLAKMSDSYKGTKSVKKYIGKLNLPLSAQEDIYLRIAMSQNKLSKTEAMRMYKNLSGKSGFRGALSKVIGNNPQGTVGHLNELRIANSAAEKGFDVVAIGKKFNDGLKLSDTDIDILLHKDGVEILIEAKKYASTTKMPLDKFRGDLDTLNKYAEMSSGAKVLKVFTFTDKPVNKSLLKQYKFWAKKKKVELVFGSPQQQVEQIEQLLRLRS
jgi:hypothetical protein